MDTNTTQMELFPEFVPDQDSPYTVDQQKQFWEAQKAFYTAKIDTAPVPRRQSKIAKLLELNKEVYPLLGYTIDAYVTNFKLCRQFKCSYAMLKIDTGEKVIPAVDWVGLRSKLLSDEDVLAKQMAYRNLFCPKAKTKRETVYSDYLKCHGSISAYFGQNRNKYKFKVSLLVTKSPHGYIHFVVQGTERIQLNTPKRVDEPDLPY